MKCFRCGTLVPEGANFCGRCGTQVIDPDGSTVVVEAEDGEALLRTVRHVFAGEYEIEEELGRGGMAVVFKATEVALQRVVALKVLPPELGVTVKAAERFKREARLVAELGHPNIIPVYSAGQVGGLLHISMRYVEGRTLDRIIEAQGALPVPVVLAVLRAAARALTYAHERDIVHRDVKGGNILVDRDGRVMASDFGVALRASDVTLTAAGSIIGTPAFMSPEQCAGKRALPQSDQYALGIVAFHMLAGSVPFRAETLAGLMQHHFFTAPPDLFRVRPDLPPSLVECVNRMLAKDSRQRFERTRELLTALGAVPFTEIERHESERMLRDLARGTVIDRVRTEEVPALPELPTMLMSPPRLTSRRRTLMRAAGAAATVVLVASAAIWARGAGERSEPIGSQVSAPTPTPLPAQPAPAPRATGKVRVLTNPPDAVILVDGRQVGEGSLWDFRVTAGPRRIGVRAPGYRPFDTALVVTAGATVSLGRIALEVVAPQ
ncbi:MAG TPA: protein kinase [Gemmatimonadales bacterium]